MFNYAYASFYLEIWCKTMQTTVNLSENAYQYVSSIAQLTERTIDEVIEETFENRFVAEVEMLKKKH